MAEPNPRRHQLCLSTGNGLSQPVTTALLWSLVGVVLLHVNSRELSVCNLNDSNNEETEAAA